MAEYSDQLQDCDGKPTDKITIQEEDNGQNTFVHIVIETEEGRNVSISSDNSKNDEQAASCPNTDGIGEAIIIESSSDILTRQKSKDESHLNQGINASSIGCVVSSGEHLTSMTSTPTPPPQSLGSAVLPWGARKDKMQYPAGIPIDTEIKPGEFVMRTLFAEFTFLAEKKIEQVLAEPLERPLSKSLQRGEDQSIDQLLGAFGSVAEHCLPSLLRTLFAWYDRQGLNREIGEQKRADYRGKGETVEKTERDCLNERRDLAVEFIFCLVLIEVLKQLPVHPGHEGLVSYIENLAFKHFKFREGSQTGLNAASSIHIVSDLYAEVIGVLAQSRFKSVRKKFTSELRELRCKEPSAITTQSIISLLMGMKFFRVKMVPIEEFEASMQFLQECAQYFIEVKDKDIKHALAGLFVEILLPVGAIVKNEVNVPVLKNFVEMLYSQTLDMATKKKHSLALFPLVTCLLCVSQKSFFLQNWHYFLAMCLSHLKNRDPKMSRVALESLYRLLWVYMIRIKCESNTATQSRLQSIVNSLFPKGSKAVVPRDTPLNIFVKIIQFVAQERLDFAMKEIVFDLLSVGRPIKIILTPERMSIGLRAFLVVADSLQQKEGDPPMPRTVGVLPSGNTLRVKKTFLSKMLTEDAARSIGISSYYPYVRKAFDDILRALDAQFGRTLMMTNVQNINKEPDDMITGERKPKIDLFRTCIAAIPRLIPDGMSRHDLVDLLSRLTVHWDEELRGLACQSLQNLILDFPDWREDVIYGYVQLLIKEVNDSFPHLLDNGLRMLLQLLTSWKNAVTAPMHIRKDSIEGMVVAASHSDRTQAGIRAPESLTGVLHFVEGFALVMLCNFRPTPRRLAVFILKEAKSLLRVLITKEEDVAVIDVIDKACPAAVEKCLPLLPAAEKTVVLSAANIDLQWLAERTTPVWTSCFHDVSTEGSAKNLAHSLGGMDAWYLCLVSFLDRENLLLRCPAAVGNSWPIAFIRFSAVFSLLDPNPINDNRASILRSSATVKKPTNERDQHLILWRNYVMFVCCVIPPNCSPVVRCASPDLSLSSSPDSLASDRSESRSPNLSGVTATAFYKLAVPLIRCESADIRDAVVLGLGHINYEAIKDLMEELVIYIREAIDRKQENMRRRRRRDALRVQLAKVFELIAEQGTFGSSLSVFDRDAISLHPTFVEYIDGARLYLESEQEKDVPAVQEIKGHFCGFIRKLIKSFPLENRPTLLSRELRRNLFQLLAGWSGKIAASLADKRLLSIGKDDGHMKELEFSALQSMFTVLCCGPTFDPQLLAEDGDIYPCLDNLLGSADERVYQLAQDTIVLLLEFNPDISALLDWVVDRCYTGSNNVADGCFTALATIFSAREYPCDHYMAIINVTLMNSGCPRGSIHEMALQLLQILDKRFFGSLVPVCSETTDNGLDVCKGTEMGLPPGPLLSCTFTHSQMRLSRQLSKCHPELTMPMFSEITHRFQMARYPVRQLLLQYLLPWLDNMELVDPHIPPGNPLSPFLSKMQDFYTDSPSKQSFRKEGWGSAEATEMVLNNLFYITAKFGDEHPKEIEELWKVLCACWPNNLRVIIRYLFIVTGMAPSELLPYAKRVVVYVGRAQPERLVDDLTNELQTVENMNCVIERTETPPFFRVTSMRKTSSHSSSEVHTDAITRTDLVIEKGTIHTKRHSREDPICREGSLKGNLSSHGSVRSACSLSSTGSGKADVQLAASSPGTGSDDHGDNGSGDDNFVILRRQAEEKANTPLPRPLPMPEYGGYFSPLTEFLPDSSQPVSGFHRCNLAVMLLTDVVVDDLSIDWSMHVPLMLHIIFLGLDHTRSLVYEHCKKLLLNLLTVVAKHNDHITVARIYLNNKTRQQGLGLVPPSLQILQCNLTEPGLDIDSAVQCEQRRQQCEQKQHQFGPITVNIGSPANVSTDEGSRSASPTAPPQLSPNNQEGNGVQTEEIAKALIDFIASRKAQPMWGYEDITAKVWSIRSAQQLATFLHHVLCVFKESLPQAHIEERWSQIALQVALSCSSRHYAGRSLQIFRALGAPITPQMLSEILSRLVETVAEQGEDMQGYVTELMLTLEAAVDGLDSDFRPLDFVKELFKSTPNLNKDNRKCTAAIPISQSYPGQPPPGHARSTSYSVTFCTRKPILGSPTVEVKSDARSRCSTDSDSRTKMTNLSRSRSAQSLKMMADQSLQDDKLAMLAQLFWIAICILESDYEYEFQLAMRLLDRVISRLPLERPDCREKVEKLQSHLKWNNFPGVHALLLKGCTSPVTYEPTLNVLAKFTTLFDLPIVDPTLAVAFPLNVMALLPYMLQNYEDPNMLCIQSAECIAQVCMEKSKKLDNLATVMTLYSRRTFSKESFQWTKCVVKYLFDAYAHFSLNMIAFLVEILEKGPSSTQQAILSIVHCMLHYLDLNTSAAQSINADLLRVIAKYVEGPYWKEALKILKLAVTRSSVLAAPPSSSQFSAHFMDTTSISSHTSFMETEIFAKKELPGRTMEFSFDLSQTPVIGRRYQVKGTQGKEDSVLDSKIMTGSITDAASSYSPRHSVSLTQSMMADTGALSGWKRPWLSQARTREWLVNLLTSCGQRVGLPKSPSDTVINKVIFSQSSDVVDRQSSMYSSTEEVSVVNNDMSVDSKLEDNSTTDQQFGVFKDFDFLDNELESQEGESMDNFNWGVRRRSLSNLEENEQVSLQDSGLTGSTPNLASNKEESSDDEMTSTSPMDDAHVELGNEGINLFRSNSLRDRTHHRCSPTSGSSICSEVELGELTPSNHSPVFSILGPSFMSGAVSSRNGSASETETLWRRHVQLLMNDSYGSLAPSTYPIFSKMFKELRHKFAMLTRECCQYLAHLDTPRPTAAPFLNLLEALAALAECPQVFIDTEAFLACQLLDRHKFCVLELQEHLDTYLERREHTVECLNSIKSTLKMQAVSDAIAEFSAEEQHLDLCRCLYKLHFQLLLLYDSYCKMTCLLTTAAKHSQVVDMSWEVACMRNELLRTSEETEGDILSSDVPPDPELNSQQEAEHALLDLLTSRKWNRAIQLLRTHRRLWPSDCNSGGDDDEVDTILGIYCKYICDRKSGVVIVTRLEHDLTEVCSQLMDVNVQLSTSVRVLERALQASKEPVELGLRKTQC